MSTLLTPEHLQLLSKRHLEETITSSDRTSAADTTEARMARFELRRRQCQVPVRHRYASVNTRSVAR